MGERTKCFGLACLATHDLPFGAIAAAHWLTIRAVEVWICMYPAEWLFVWAHITWKRFDRFRSFKHSENSSGGLISPSFVKKIQGRWIVAPEIGIFLALRELAKVWKSFYDFDISAYSPLVNVIIFLSIHWGGFVCYVNSGAHAPPPKYMLAKSWQIVLKWSHWTPSSWNGPRTLPGLFGWHWSHKAFVMD